MAQQFHFVYIDKPNTLIGDRNIEGKLKLIEEYCDSISIFTDIRRANMHAQNLAKDNPGYDVYVLAQTHGFFTQRASNATKKVWTKDGYYIPEEKESK